MPTVPRRPAAQRERDRLQARRLRAAELFAASVRQVGVARQLGVSAQAVSVWHARWQASGTDGFTGELWTLERIALVIRRLTGVRHHLAWVWALLRHRLAWSVQRPERRAAERDQAAIDRWVAERWPAIKQTPNGAEPAWSSSTKARSA
jgi:transposase